MYRSGPLPLTFEGPEQGLWGKNCQNASQGRPSRFKAFSQRWAKSDLFEK